MTVKIKKIKYLIPPKDIFNDALDVFVSLEDDYCTDGSCYFIEVTTPQFLSTIMEKENNAFYYRTIHVLLFQLCTLSFCF